MTDSTPAAMSVTAVAHANIALIKYWGKADAELILPVTPSLSLTLDALYTTTTVTFGAEPGTDTATLDGEPVTGKAMARITALLDLVRQRAGIAAAAQVTSVNTVPTAAGLASSASGFAALAGAAAAAAGLDLDDRELSRLARRGSGSASRSIYGGLAMWHAGFDDESSYAEPVDDPTDLASSLAMVVLVLNAGEKSVSSRDGMAHTVETSPEYWPWVESHKNDLAGALEAVAAGDLATLGEIAERNAAGMHRTMQTAVPPVDYLTDASRAALAAVKAAREAGLPAWATMDAGPNVKVLTTADKVEELDDWLKNHLADTVPGLSTVIARSGEGMVVTR
ncbi:diphosphomevalonate decarboxylase [Candidatus Corynebacterium faecigallinarum]|uniref:diphosphomevalonate decarboxylase n=1 Tax=Candidatus Corynebacterium faecigallinarum TaxID=2838528 RepID=UPI003FD0D0D0